MREPQWESGAYSEQPHIQRLADGQVICRASIECWLGTPEEFISIPTAVRRAFGGDVAWHRAIVSKRDGTYVEAISDESLGDQLAELVHEGVNSIRIECSSADGSVKAVVLASPEVPGLLLELIGNDEAKVLGAAQIAFRRMMAGYVDRLGGWRGLAWMIASLAPFLLTTIAFAPGAASRIARAIAAGVGFASSIATMLLLLPRFQVAQSFVLVATEPTTWTLRGAIAIRALVERPSIRRTLGVLGALGLGIVGNKLAELLPWP